MDLFSKDLKDALNKSFGIGKKWEVNPLVVIGLTETILDLGLNEDQIFSATRSYCRQLAAQVHPDKNPVNVSKERQKQILEAFNLIDDRQIFVEALNEFRNLKAFDRKETTILSNLLTDEKRKVADYEGKIVSQRVAQDELNRQIAEFNKLKEDEPLLLPNIQAINKGLEIEIRKLKESLKAQEDRNREYRDVSDFAMSYIANLGMYSVRDGVFWGSAKWIVTANLDWQIKNPDLSPFDGSGEAKDGFKKAMFLAGSKSKDTENVLNNWKTALGKYGTIGPEDKRMLLGISVMSLSSGMPKLLFGSRTGILGGRVVGSMFDPNSINNRNFLARSINYKTIIEYLRPNLIEGSLMVSISSNPNLKASWSLKCPSFKFNTKRIILGVG